jgi:hypothetical protein
MSADDVKKVIALIDKMGVGEPVQASKVAAATPFTVENRTYLRALKRVIDRGLISVDEVSGAIVEALRIANVSSRIAGAVASHVLSALQDADIVEGEIAASARRRLSAAREFISQVTEDDVDRSSTLEQFDIGKWALYANDAIAALYPSKAEAEAALKVIKSSVAASARRRVRAAIDYVAEAGKVGPLTIDEKAYAVGRHTGDKSKVKLYDWKTETLGGSKFIKDMSYKEFASMNSDLAEKLSHAKVRDYSVKGSSARRDGVETTTDSWKSLSESCQDLLLTLAKNHQVSIEEFEELGFTLKDATKLEAAGLIQNLGADGWRVTRLGKHVFDVNKKR